MIDENMQRTRKAGFSELHFLFEYKQEKENQYESHCNI